MCIMIAYPIKPERDAPHATEFYWTDQKQKVRLTLKNGLEIIF